MLLKLCKGLSLRIGSKAKWQERIVPEVEVPLDIRRKASSKDDDGMVLCLEI